MTSVGAVKTEFLSAAMSIFFSYFKYYFYFL